MTASAPRIRLFADLSLTAGARFMLSGADAHYLAAVMRQKAGAEILFFNGRDGEWAGRLEAVSRKKIEVALSRQTRMQSREPDLWLAFAPIKRTRIDFIAAKATELGIAKLLPVTTEHTAVGRVKTERLLANAKEAAEQCARLTVPSVEPSQTLKALLANWPKERLLAFCDEGRTAPLLTEAVLRRDQKPAAKPWAILIGPEGGFSEAERTALRALPFTVPASLGPRLLRADSAAFAAISLWQAALGDWA